MVFLGMGLEEPWRSLLSSVRGARRFCLLTGKCISMVCVSSTSPVYGAGVLECTWDYLCPQGLSFVHLCEDIAGAE